MPLRVRAGEDPTVDRAGLRLAPAGEGDERSGSEDEPERGSEIRPFRSDPAELLVQPVGQELPARARTFSLKPTFVTL